MSEARKRKNRRLKQAKEEAQQEIEKYKQERELEFKVISEDTFPRSSPPPPLIREGVSVEVWWKKLLCPIKF